MMGDALHSHPSLKEINLIFFQPGHTYMECDTMHSTIERESRHQKIYTPNDWIKIVCHTKEQKKKTGQQYSVYPINYDQF